MSTDRATPAGSLAGEPLAGEPLAAGLAGDDREQLVRELREREAMYRAMFERNRAVKLLIDPADGSIVDANPAASDFYGYPAAELRRMRITEINTLPEAEVRQGIRQATSGQRMFHFVHRLASGEKRDVEVWTGPIEIQGRALLFSIVHDVTERRAAERALRKSEERYRGLFEQSRDAVLTATPDGRVSDVNPAGLALLGLRDLHQVVGEDLFAAIGAAPEQRAGLVAELADRGFVADFETVLTRRDGSLATVVGSLSAVRDGDGQPLASLAILRDVTQQRALEDQLRQAQKMEAVGRLAGGLAHDFNNLLTAINGYGDLLYRQLPAGDVRRSYVEEIRQAGRRATDLTAKLLTLSRRKVVSPHRVDLNQVVRSVEELLRRLIGEDVELVTRLQPGLGTVHVDPGEVEQVLLNLAVNARDAMPTGGVLTLETADVRRGDPLRRGLPEDAVTDYVRLTVRDTGVGIEAEIQEHIFEPFFTTKEQGKGTGLGLSTVYATVHRSEGRITVESAPDEGAAFHVFLPRVAGAPEETRRERTWRPGIGGHETVLVAEDDPAVRQLVRQLLEEQGYRVYEAADAEEAREQLERLGEEVDLLLSDVVMPGTSGPELAASLRPSRPDLRILFMSGYTDSFLVQHGLEASSDTVLQKPFSAEALAERVRALLDAAPQQETPFSLPPQLALDEADGG